MKYVFSMIVLMTPAVGSAETKPWAHESEASVVKVSGNTKSDSIAAKQTTSYSFDQNKIVGAARYLNTRSGTVDTAKSWSASLRYERALSDSWSAFVQHGAESDEFAKYIQRDSTDAGGKYVFFKNEQSDFFSELGYRLSKTIPTSGGLVTTNGSVRAYLEYNNILTKSLSARLWLEYLPNLDDADAYLMNYEPSMSVMLSSIFSLKLSYLVKYHNKTTTVGEDKEDSTFTTSLVAKF